MHFQHESEPDFIYVHKVHQYNAFLKENAWAYVIMKSNFFLDLPDALLILKKNRNQLKTKYSFANLEVSVSSKKFYINVIFWEFINVIKIQIIQMVEFMLNNELKDALNQSQLSCVIIRIIAILILIVLGRNKWHFLPFHVISSFISLSKLSFYAIVNQILSLVEPSEINVHAIVPSSSNFIISDVFSLEMSIVWKW
jgi:hypothetical protein